MVLIANFYVNDCTTTEAQIRQKNKICNESIHHVFHPFLQRLASFPQLCPFLKKRARELGNQFFVRARLLNVKKNLCICTISSSTKLVPHLRLLFRTFPVMYMYFLTWQDVHQCNKVDFPCCFVCLFTTSLHSLSTAASASGINIALVERFFAHTLRFPSQASLRDRSPELCEPFVTLGSFVCTPEIRWAEQYPKFILLSSAVHTWEYLVLPRFEGYSKNFVPQTRRVAKRDNMRLFLP